jgi:hypothetical protein
MDNPFSRHYLGTVPGSGEVFGPFAIAFAVVFAIGFLACVIVYNGWGRSLFPNGVIFRMARKWGGWGVCVFGLGLFFFAIRALQINPFGFGKRAWLWISILLALAWIGWIVYDIVRNYQTQLSLHQEHVKKREYARATSSLMGQGAPSLKSIPNVPVSRPVKKKRR